MKTIRNIAIMLALLAAVGQRPTAAQKTDAPEALIASVLDNVHKFASTAEFENYFAQYAPDAIFFGTDPEERWTISDFKAYARPAFERGGWTYHQSNRHIYLSSNGETAWFDEELENANYGMTRGTGVLVLTPSGWRVAQYNLSIPLPNDITRDVVRQIQEFNAKQ
jgi:SnoaL-like domain